MRVVKTRYVVLVCVWILCVCAFAQTPVRAHPVRPAPARRQQLLVKRINQGALRFYKAFINESVRSTFIDCDLNDLLEDLLLATDSLNDPRFIQHNLLVVMQIAADIEEELLCGGHPSTMLIGWSRLHADLDRLARLNGIKWNEVVFPDQLIASSRHY